MIAARVLSILLLLLLLAVPRRLRAAWEILKVAAGAHNPAIELAGDVVAYAMDGDLHLYRISSGRPTRVTRDGCDPEDSLIGLDTEALWYWAQDRETSLKRLHRYDLRSGEDAWLVESDALIDVQEGVAEAGRVVVWKDYDWFLLDGDQLEQVTFSGQSLGKQDAWLTGEYLVWRAVSGVPGVYVTHLHTAETTCVFWDNDPPGSLWASGMHAAWVAGPAQGEYWVFFCRLDTGEFEIVGSTEERTPWQLAMDFSRLVWIRKVGPLWLVMSTNLAEETEECLYFSYRAIHSPRVSGDSVLFITENCPEEDELCSELNVLDRKTGRLIQLTRFGRDTLISSPRIDAGRVAFGRHSGAFPPVEAVYAGYENPQPPGWTLSGANHSDAALNVALLLPPLAVAPWCRRRRRHGSLFP